MALRKGGHSFKGLSERSEVKGLSEKSKVKGLKIYIELLDESKLAQLLSKAGTFQL